MKRILMFILLLLGLVSGVNAVLTDNSQAYYKWDGSLTEDSANSFTLSNSGVTLSTSGKINNASSFDGSDHMTQASAAGLNGLTSGSLNMWLKFTSESTGWNIFAKNAAAFRAQYSTVNDDISWQVDSEGTLYSEEDLDWTQWHMVTFIWNGTHKEIYVDGSFSSSVAFTGTSPTGTLYLGHNSVNTNERYNGLMDEFGTWDRALTSIEVSELYNSSTGLQYPFTPTDIPTLTFDNITVNNVTLTNNSFFNNTMFFNTQVLNVSTNSNINQSYSLNGGVFTQYATNNFNGVFDLNLSEGFNNISFQAINNETSVNSSNFSFIVDRTAPVINIIGNLTQDTFFVNFSTIFDVNYSISGEKSCTMNITYLSANESDSNFFINCTDTQTFTRAGDYNGFLTAEDNAGNIVTGSVNGSINPVINIFFNQTNGTILTNYSPTIYHPDGRITIPTIQGDGSIQLSPINNGTLDLGLHTIQFERLGFATENFTQIVNATNAGTNTTFTVTSSKIIVSIFDVTSGLPLTGLTTLTGVATVGFNANTTTGFVNISNINFISELYQIVADHDNYTTESIFFNYDNQELLPVNIFMLATNNSNFGTATVKVKSSPEELFISNARCDLLEWNPTTSAYSSVSQGVTDVNGEYTFNVQLNIKLYKASCTSEGNTAEQVLGNGGIITTTGLFYPVLISTVDDSIENKLGSVTFSYTNSTVTNTTQRLIFSWSDSNGIVTQGCIKTYQSTGFGKQIINETCVSTSTGEIQIIVNTNNTYNLFAEAVIVTSDGVSQTMSTIIFQSVESFENLMKKYHLDLVIPLVFFFLGVGLGLTLEPQNIYIALVTVFILEWLTFAMIPTTVSFTTVTFISVILGFLYWGTNK